MYDYDSTLYLFAVLRTEDLLSSYLGVLALQAYELNVLSNLESMSKFLIRLSSGLMVEVKAVEVSKIDFEVFLEQIQRYSLEVNTSFAGNMASFNLVMNDTKFYSFFGFYDPTFLSDLSDFITETLPRLEKEAVMLNLENDRLTEELDFLNQDMLNIYDNTKA